MRSKNLKVLLCVITSIFFSCSTQNSSQDKKNIKPNSLLLTYQNLNGNSIRILQSDIKSYLIGNESKTEFGCPACPSIDGDRIIYSGKKPLTFIIKVPKNPLTVKADENVDVPEEASIVIPYDLYKNTSEDFDNEGLIYNIKQNLKDSKPRFSKKDTNNTVIFEISGGILDKSNNLKYPLAINFSDESEISFYKNESSVSDFNNSDIQKGNSKPLKTRVPEESETTFLKNVKSSLSKIAVEQKAISDLKQLKNNLNVVLE